MALDTVRDCQQAFAAATPAAWRIEHDEGQAKPLAGPDTWQGRDAHHWLTDWHHTMNRMMHLLDSLPQAERAAVHRAHEQSHGGQSHGSMGRQA